MAATHGLWAVGNGKLIMNILIGLGLLLAVISPALLLGAVYSYYCKYYKYMKMNHEVEWKRLMNRDNAVELIGEWYRYPFGSGYLIASFFDKETYGDSNVADIKTRAMRNLRLSVGALILAVVVIVLIQRI